MKNYFKSNRFLFLGVVLLLIIFSFYFKSTPKANAMCEFPGRYPFWMTIYDRDYTPPVQSGRCLYDCYGNFVGCTCSVGYHPNPLCADPETCRSCVKDTTGGMSGTLLPSVSTCIIPLGENSCKKTLTWTTTNPVGTSAVTSALGTPSPVNGNNGSQEFTVPHPTFGVPPATYVRFFLYNNGEPPLASAQVTPECAPGSVWKANQNACITSPISVTIVASPSSVTLSPSGASTTLTWTTTGSPTSCTASESWSDSKDVAGGSQQITYSFPGGAGIYNYAITCTKGTTTVSNSASVEVLNAQLPDLRISETSPSSVMAGVPVTMHATVYNYGNQSVNQTVPHVLELTDVADPNNAGFEDIIHVMTHSSTEIPAFNVSTNTPGSVQVSWPNYTFPTKQDSYTVYARACADLDVNTTPPLQGTVTETDESNNCSAKWIAVTVVRPTPDNASCGPVNVPTSVVRGNTFTAQISMINTGSNTWKSSSVDSVNPYKLGSQTPPGNLVWLDRDKIELPTNLVPTQSSAVFSFNAIAPNNPDVLQTCSPIGNGSYSCGFEWGMLQDGPGGAGYFGTKCGQNITVTASASTGDGACSFPAKHYTCATDSTYVQNSGISLPAKWVWTCAGPSSSKSCEELKKKPIIIER